MTTKKPDRLPAPQPSRKQSKKLDEKTLTNLDKLTFRYPKMAAFLQKFSAKPGSTCIQDMALCAAVMLASGFYDFEGFFFPPLTFVIQGVLTFCVAAVWLWCFFLNGFWRRHGFLVFAVVYWVVPRLIIIREQTASIFEYSRYLAAAGEISLLLVEFPMKGLSAFFRTSVIQTSIALCAWCLAVYLLGYVIGRYLRRGAKGIRPSGNRRESPSE
jgi:hypothetical protein